MAGLLRVLGLGFGLAVIVGNTVGSGILRAPGEVARDLPPRWGAAGILAVWLAGGLYALLGALCLSELGAMWPRSGGYYVFARRALGDFAGFVVGWTDWLAQSGTIAAASILVAEYAAPLHPALGGRPVAVALATAIALAVVQARGVRWGARAQALTSAAKGAGLLALVAAFFLLAPAGGHGAGGAIPAAPPPASAAPGLLLALQAVIYTYDGWYGVIYFGEEVRQPARDVPRSMIGGVLIVAALYLLVNLALLAVLPPARLAGQPLAVGAAVQVILGPRGAAAVDVLAILCVVGGINAYHLMASRIPLAMSRDGLLPPVFAAVNRGGTPVAGLAASTTAAALFILWGGFAQVLAVMAFFFVANYVMAFVAVFVLRRREPGIPRPFRVPGHPLTTGLALAVSLAFLVATVLGDGRNGLLALLVLAASHPVYRLLRRFGTRWNPR
jgi:APA family basic amino acid/polyamine antiporter